MFDITNTFLSARDYLYNLKHVAYNLESNIYNTDVIHQKQFQLNLKYLLIL